MGTERSSQGPTWGRQGLRVAQLASTQARLLRPSAAPTAVRRIRVAAILLAPPHPQSKDAARPLAGQGLSGGPAELGQGVGQQARSGLREAAAIYAKVGVGVGRSSRLLQSGPGRGGGAAARALGLRWSEPPRPVPGPPSSPASLRPNGLGGPG